MAFRKGVSEVDVTEWRGSIQRLDPYAVDLAHSLLTINNQFQYGSTFTRYGHSTVFMQTDGRITAFVNWFFSLSGALTNTITYYCPTVGVKAWQQGGGGFTGTLIPVTAAAGATMVPSGLRLYAGFYDATGRTGASPGYVYGWNIGEDKLFAPPISNALTCAETAAGVCTAGTRRVAYMFTTRNGYTGTLCPFSNSTSVFTPTVFTSTGGKNIQCTITGALPSYLVGGTASVFQVVMTTTTNLNQWFAVPGARATCFNPTVINVSISDDDLTATGTDVTNQLDLLTISFAGGINPINPSAIVPYSSRMSYIGIDLAGFPVIYMSEPNDYQHVTPDQHAIYLENLQQAVTAFSFKGVYYSVTQNSVYSCEDNGDVPVSWIPPQRVDGSVGVLSPTCVAYNPSLGYALIASERGFYIFQGGVFPALPLSYYQSPDWNRINWTVATTVTVVDDPLNKKFTVLAPLNDIIMAVSGTGPYTITTKSPFHGYQPQLPMKITGVSGTPTVATVTGNNTFTIAGGAGVPTVGGTIQPQTASHEMTWDYTEGDTPETVKYSLNYMANFVSGAIGQVLNATTSLTEVWSAPYVTGGGSTSFIRRNDGTEATPYRDVSNDGSNPQPINSWTQSALLPGPSDPDQNVMPSTIHQFAGAHLRVLGNGNLTMRVAGLDGKLSITPARSPMALSAASGQEELVQWNFWNEQESFACGTNAIDAWFLLTRIRAYYTEKMKMR